MNLCLSTAPDYEIVTSRLHAYMIPVLKELELYNTDVSLLEKNEVTRENLERFSQGRNFLFLMGHGDKDRLSGSRRDDMVLDTNNSGITAGKVVYALSCLTADVLGREAVREGATAYCGYFDEYQLWIESGKHPLRDGLARACVMPALEFVRSLYAGKTTGEALEDTKKAFEEMIDLWNTIDRPEASFVVAALENNLEILTLLGSEDARVSEPYTSLRTILKSVLFD